MVSIYDYETISAILDCTNVVPTDHPYKLLGCSDITTHTIVEVASGVATIQDVDRFATAKEWLQGQGILDSDITDADLLSLLSDSRDCILRAGEFIKVMLYASMHGNSEYAAAGFATGVFCPVQVQATVGLGSIARPQGYEIVDASGAYTDENGVGYALQPLANAGIDTKFELSRGLGYGKYAYFPDTDGVKRTHTLSCGYLNTDFVSSYQSVTLEAVFRMKLPDGRYSTTTLNMRGSRYVDATTTLYAKLKFTWKSDGYQYVSALSSASNTSGYGVGSVTDMYSDDVKVVGPIVSGGLYMVYNGNRYQIGQCFPYGIRYPNTMDGTQTGKTMYPLIYIPDTGYNGDSYVGYANIAVDDITYTITSVSGATSPIFTDDAAVAVSGSITGGSYEVQYLADPVPIDGDAGSITKPSVVAGSTNTLPVQLTFDSFGVRHIGSSAPVPSNAVVTSDVTVTDIPDLVARAVTIYDTPSVYEDLDDITAEAISTALGTTASISDPYIASMFDYTIDIMCSDQISNIRAFMLDDHGILYDTWSEQYFMDVILEQGQSVSVFSWARVRLADATEYYDVTNPPSALTYEDGVLTASEDVSIHVENFVWGGRSLDEWWNIRNTGDAAPFYAALTAAQLESDTQVLLHQALNGVINSVNWLSDVGQVLDDAISEARQFVSDTVAAVGEANLTTNQRYALLGSVAEVAVPATRVSELLTTAANMGATSATEVLKILDQIPQGAGSHFSVTQVSDTTAKAIMDMFVAMNPSFGRFKLNCTQERTFSTDVKYGSTFLDRLGSSLISAGGVECEVTDVGEGLRAIYPALLNGTVYLPDADLGLTTPIVLPLRASVVVVYPTPATSGYTVAWHAKHKGGSDADVVVSIQAALNELKTFMDSIGAPLTQPVVYYPPNVADVTYTGRASDVDLVNYASAAAMGAVAGASVGLVGTPLLSLVLAGVGAGIGVAAAAYCNSTREDTPEDNLDYSIRRLEGNAGSMSIGTSVTSDPDEIGFAMATFVMAAVAHGAYYPYGYEGLHDLSIPDRFAAMSPGNPYFKYVYTGESEDWSPLILTSLALLSCLQIKTLVKAFRNPTRNPSFLPVMLATAAAEGVAGIMSRASAAVSLAREPTLDMQKRILDGVSNINSGTGGVYEDTDGVVNLRDLLNSNMAMETKLNTIQEKLDQTNGPTMIPY